MMFASRNHPRRGRLYCQRVGSFDGLNLVWKILRALSSGIISFSTEVAVMKYFADDTTKPVILQRGLKKILEIGASFGSNTKMLLSIEGIKLTIIDPCLDLDLAAEFGERVTVRQGLSLDVLPTLIEQFDCIFVDGDHNWYTVFNELSLIEQKGLLQPDGVIFLHDVSWPYGRRDMYYQPSTVPSKYHQPFAMKGIERGRSKLVDSGGFNEGHLNAIEEGGPLNGVLTAIEDFVQQSEHEYYLIVDDRQWGLAILFRKSASGADQLNRMLRSQIFRRRHIEPKIRAWNDLVTKAKNSPPATMLRKCRDLLLGRKTPR